MDSFKKKLFIILLRIEQLKLHLPKTIFSPCFDTKEAFPATEQVAHLPSSPQQNQIPPDVCNVQG